MPKPVVPTAVTEPDGPGTVARMPADGPRG